MASLGAVRTGVKTTLQAAISGLWVYDKIAAVVQVPAVVVEPATADFEVAMGRGTDTWELALHVLTSDAAQELGQINLDEFVSGAGARSVRAAVFNARSLGLANTDARVAGMTAYGVRFEATEIDHIGASLRLVVHTKGTE